MSHSHLPAADTDPFAMSSIEILEEDFVFDLPMWPASMIESFIHEIIPSSPAPGDRTCSAAASPLSTTISTPVSPSHRVAMKAKRYRSRKREQLESLRATVKTLEVRLTALKARPSQDEVALSPFPHWWEAVAMLESASRQEAERENKELRETVELHRQLAQKLDHVLKTVSAQSCLVELP